MSKEIGDKGEAVIAELLRKRGYQVNEIGGNFPVIDLEVQGSVDFRISVKTSSTARHVRMGTSKSISQLRDDDFMIALLPKSGSGAIDLDSGDFEVFILPGKMAREGGLHVHETYLAEQLAKGKVTSGNAGVLVKGYSSRGPQREVWATFLEYSGRWDLLPAAGLPKAPTETF